MTDHVGHHDVEHKHNLWSNEAERQPKRNRRTGYYSILGFPNGGAMLRNTLIERFNLDPIEECYITSVIKCDPAKTKPQDRHVKVCATRWLKDEFARLDDYVPTMPILIAGNLALKGLKALSPELAKELKSLQSCRRTRQHRFGDHPLVFTFNPATVAKSEFRVEEEVSIDTHGKCVVRSVRVPSRCLPGSPIDKFRKDLEFLRPYLASN